MRMTMKILAELFPEKIIATAFSLKIEFKEKAEGPKIQLEVSILKFRLRKDLDKLEECTPSK